MNHAHANRVGDVGDIALGIVAPDGREGMRAHVQQMSAAGIPFIFDPGQGMPLFSGDELVEMIDSCQVSGGQRLRGTAAQRADRAFASRISRRGWMP